MRVWGLVRGVAAVVVASAPLWAAPTPAWADAPPAFPPCTKEPSAADVEGAAGSHRAAKAYYERGEYDKAVQLWRDAYSFDCSKPAVFLNMGNAYEKKGDKAAAVAMFETYLARAPKDAPDAGTISAKVQNLKASLASEPAAPAPAATTAPADPAPAPTQPDVLPPPPGERPYGVVPWVVAGAGVAAIGAGVVVVLIGQGKVSQAEEDCGGSRGECKGKPGDSQEQVQGYIDDGNSGRSLTTTGIIVAGVGGAALAGGLIWQFAFNKPRATTALQPGVQVAPMVSPKTQGLLVTGRF